MLPRELRPDSFAAYPPQARRLVNEHLAVLQALPLSLLPALLREMIDYDFKFPAERTRIESELTVLGGLPPEQLTAWMEPFSTLSLSPQLEGIDWVNQPGAFLEQESAWLWSTHQQDAFSKAAI